jgi:hypothetical protein
MTNTQVHQPKCQHKPVKNIRMIIQEGYRQLMQRMIIATLVTIFILFLPLLAQALTLSGQVKQGGMAVGKVPPGSTVHFDDKPIRVSPQRKRYAKRMTPEPTLPNPLSGRSPVASAESTAANAF